MAILLLLSRFEFVALLGIRTELSVTENCVHVWTWDKLPVSTDQKQFVVSFTSNFFLMKHDLAKQRDAPHPTQIVSYVGREKWIFTLSFQ